MPGARNVPIDKVAYHDVTTRMGEAKMPGLLVHIALEEANGNIGATSTYGNLSEPATKVFQTVVHPAVHGVLTERGIHVTGEPPRMPLNVVEVRYADGSAISS